MFDKLRTRLTHKIYSLPVLVLMPHSSCNCRCVMCDIWKANQNKQEISIEELDRHIQTFRKLKVEEVALSGGEALMHTNLWRFCELLNSAGIKITLLSTGLLLEKNAERIIQHLNEVIVSLDGSRDVHNQIRNIPLAFEKLETGVKALKRLNPNFPVKARCVLQKQNFRDLPNIITTAKNLGLDQISFLTADVSTDAFNRPEPWTDERVSQVALTEGEYNEFRTIIISSFSSFDQEYRNKFIAEPQTKMLSLAYYYAALLGLREFPPRKCNAPRVSAVIESDGEVRPCFFHESYGNILGKDFLEVVNSPKAIQFRKQLDTSTNGVCQRCVCSLYKSPFSI